MYSTVNHPTLEARLNGIISSQSRARISFFILLYASGAVLFGLWNMYLSWERQWAEITEDPVGWGKEKLLQEQIGSWLEGQSIGISAIGLKISVSDINVLGAFLLFLLSYYFCLCMRRENHDIGSLLIDTKDCNQEIKHHILAVTKSGMILSPSSQNDSPYSDLNSDRIKKRIFFSRPVGEILVYLPVIAILVTIYSDIYFSLFYKSPWRNNPSSVWSELNATYRTQIVLCDVIGLIFCIVTLVSINNARKYIVATNRIVKQFHAHL